MFTDFVSQLNKSTLELLVVFIVSIFPKIDVMSDNRSAFLLLIY